MTAHITKTWVEDGKLITQVFDGKDIYKRTWVGLTHEKRVSIIREDENRSLLEHCERIEAELKEKNA